MAAAGEVGAQTQRAPSERFATSHAVMIAVDAYTGVRPLRNAVADARAIGEVLARDQQFRVRELYDGDATRAALVDLFATLPATVGERDRLVLYFAGHGVAAPSMDRAAGHLLPVDARRGAIATYVDMSVLYEALEALPCRHVLVVLDCCFAGTFRWPRPRDDAGDETVYRQTYDRFTDSPAWQALTSAARDQKALDSFLFEGREELEQHSPFAHALLGGLAGAADRNRDGLITATDLYVHIRETVEELTKSRYEIQTPGLFPMRRHESGEFVFAVPSRPVVLAPLTETGNPYRALEVYHRDDRDLLFGRADEERALVAAIEARPLTLLVGPSGTGKSSLLNAKIAPALEDRWTIVGPRRAAEIVERGLGAVARTAKPVLIIVDQLEELVTRQLGDAGIAALLASIASVDDAHIVASVRSDFEPLLRTKLFASRWQDARFFLGPMRVDQLRSVVEEPARLREIYFSPPDVVDRLVNEVVHEPGALALLSLTLSRLYLTCWPRMQATGRREITRADYEALGGVATAVTDSADGVLAELVALDPAYELTVRNAVVRMTSTEGGVRARRPIARSLLVFDDAEDARVTTALARFEAARLVVPVSDGFLEPAHDVLVLGWPRLERWLADLPLAHDLRALEAAAVAASANPSDGLLWATDPRLPALLPLATDATHRLNAAERTFLARSETKRTRDERTRTRRRWTITGAALAAAAILGVLALYASDSATRATTNEHRAQDQTAIAERERLVSEARRVNAMLDAPGGWLDALPVAMAAAAPHLVDGTNPPQVTGALARAVYASVPVVELPAPNETRGLAISGDDRVVVTADTTGVLQRWNARTGALLERTQVDDTFRWADVDQSGATIVTAGRSGARIWTTSPLASRCVIPCSGNTLSVQLSRDGRTVLPACDDRTFDVRTVPSCEPLAALDAHRSLDDRYGANFPVPATIAPDARVVATPAGRTIELWATRPRRLLGTAVSPTRSARYVTAEYARDANIVLATRADDRADVWDVGRPDAPAFLRTQEAASAAISPDGTAVVSEYHGAIQLFSSDGNSPATSSLTGRGLAWPAFTSDGRRITALGDDGLLRIWDVGREAPVVVLRSHTSVVDAVAGSTGRLVAASTRDGMVRVWDIGRSAANLPETVSSLELARDQHRVASALDDGSIVLWDATTGAAGARWPAHAMPVGTVVFSRDGRLAATLSVHELDIVELASETRRAKLMAEDDTIFETVDFDPAGERLVTAGLNQPPRLWNARTGAPIATLPVPGVSRAAWATGRDVLLFRRTGALDSDPAGRVVVWDTVAGHARRELHSDDLLEAVGVSPDGATVVTLHRRGERRIGLVWRGDESPIELAVGVVRSTSFDAEVSFSNDGTRFVTTALEQDAQIWSTATGAREASVRTPAGRITAVQLFDRDRRLATVDSDRMLRVWDAATGAELGAFDDVERARLSSDGRWLVAASDRRMRTLDLSERALFAKGCNLLATRRSTPALGAEQLALLRRICP